MILFYVYDIFMYMANIVGHRTFSGGICDVFCRVVKYWRAHYIHCRYFTWRNVLHWDRRKSSFIFYQTISLSFFWCNLCWHK